MAGIIGNPRWLRSSAAHAGTPEDPLPTWTFGERVEIGRAYAQSQRPNRTLIYLLAAALAVVGIYLYRRG